MEKAKREVEVVVISDVHLGTYGCHAKELLLYLKSIQPKHLILNGDIVDIWQFNKRYWPKPHMQVIKHITSLLTKGVKVTYIPGNHDELIRKFVNFKIGSLKITNKAVLTLNEKKAWFFHGDVFDVVMEHSKWLAKLGAEGYDILILVNRATNFILRKLGYGPISMSKRIKNSVKSAVKFINNFENTAATIAISNKYDYVVCGHIHHPCIKEINTPSGKTTYLNSGDWIENLTALEYNNKQWNIYNFLEDPAMKNKQLADFPEVEENVSIKELQQELSLLIK